MTLLTVEKYMYIIMHELIHNGIYMNYCDLHSDRITFHLLSFPSLLHSIPSSFPFYSFPFLHFYSVPFHSFTSILFLSIPFLSNHQILLVIYALKSSHIKAGICTLNNLIHNYVFVARFLCAFC